MAAKSVVIANRLRRGVLTPTDAIGIAIASMAPAYSVFFLMGSMAAVAGAAIPVIILIAAVGFFFHVYSTAEFSRAMPHTGGYIAFVGKTFGGATGAATGLFLGVGFACGMGSVVLANGRWVARVAGAMFGAHIGWEIPTLILAAITAWLIISGVVVSTRVAVGMFIFETAVLLVAAIAMITAHPAAINGAAFNPGNILHGSKGLGLAFPFAVSMYIGLATAVPLAEEVRSPRVTVPLSLYGSLAVGTVLYLFLGWATVVGFSGNATAIAKANLAFVSAGGSAAGWLLPLLYVAGLTSGFGLMISAFNAHGRQVFGAAREGLLPGFLARINTRLTPWSALTAFLVLAVAMPFILAAFGVGGYTSYNYLATIVGICVLVLYDAVNVAMPFYFWKFARSQFSIVRHVVPAIIGVVATILPLWPLVAPGQKAPFSYFPYLILALMVAAVIYGVMLVRRRPEINESVGRLVADID